MFPVDELTTIERNLAAFFERFGVSKPAKATICSPATQSFIVENPPEKDPEFSYLSVDKLSDDTMHYEEAVPYRYNNNSEGQRVYPPATPNPITTPVQQCRPNRHEAHHTYDLDQYIGRGGSEGSSQRLRNDYPTQDKSRGSFAHVEYSPQTDYDYDSDSMETAGDDQVNWDEQEQGQGQSRWPHSHDASFRRSQGQQLSIPHRIPSHSSTAAHSGLPGSRLVSVVPATVGRAASPAFGSAAPRFPAPPSYSPHGTPLVTPAPHLRSNSAGRGARSYETSHLKHAWPVNELGSESTSSHSGSGSAWSSPQTDFEFEYDSDHGRQVHRRRPPDRAGTAAGNNRASVSVEASTALRTKSALTAEDLRIRSIRFSMYALIQPFLLYCFC
jgi:hypothetical protein